MKQIINFFKILLAVTLLSLSINLFLSPHHIAAGGASGIGILVESVTGINRGQTVLVINILMLILAFFFLGKKVFLNIFVGSLTFPIVLGSIPEIMVTQDRLLSVIFGSAIFAAGVSILYMIQASSGGTTIPPLIFKKYFNLNPSIGLLATDAVIVLLTIPVFGFEAFLFSILSIGITSIVMTYIETGLRRKKAIMAISISKTEEIRAVLREQVDRGMTIFNVKGGNNLKDRNMILMIADNQEYPEIQKLINEVDPDCFLITYNVAEVHGEGFSYHPIQ